MLLPRCRARCFQRQVRVASKMQARRFQGQGETVSEMQGGTISEDKAEPFPIPITSKFQQQEPAAPTCGSEGKQEQAWRANKNEHGEPTRTSMED